MNSELHSEIMETRKNLQKLVELLEDGANNEIVDLRWVEIGKIDLQKGMMALTRAIFSTQYF